ncbi:ATP-binding cassette domain-containing protein [Verminephrobacter eiseniae]|uniref:ABC transporter ATP-binding protein n=1 Tax=Verminephrobacter eiseniae TaxID=364317 RepID=UPI00223827DA|nr:ABC transporter ATP-binding protein [Verminephrobacter eiseniae]MCW5263336.1 ATP-binding cassette domain-containing protein [Verminephrobacter eiseniae]
MIRLSELTKHYGGACVVDRIDMEVGAGEICVLLGPSGCGKTTTLKMINRLVQPTSGKIFLEGRDTDDFDVVELRRRIGYVIQQIGLFPNMTVEENICVVPHLLGWDKARARRRAAQLLDIVALDPAIYLARYPKDLSGGQAQRVGVARALAADPPLMLMDEPFGAIDPINRELIQDEFLQIQRQVKKTILFVSHDIDEAVKMADKIAIFRGGRLEQFDTPDHILARPASPFIADFVGADRALKRLRLLRARDALTACHCALRIGQSSARAKALMAEFASLLGSDQIVLLDEDDKPLGCLTRAGLHDGALSAVHAIPMQEMAHSGDDLRSVVSSMFASGTACLPTVDDDGRFVGYVSQARVVELLRIRGQA